MVTMISQCPDPSALGSQLLKPDSIKDSGFFLLPYAILCLLSCGACSDPFYSWMVLVTHELVKEGFNLLKIYF